jgi:DNA-directed RNA polymerase specialized sigma subunit, sigma24 homolog
LRYLNEEHDNNALSHHLVEVELLKNVYKAVEQLPPMCKAVFKELYFRQSTTKEAAARLGISERNVLNQKARAISLLRGIFPGKIISQATGFIFCKLNSADLFSQISF